MFTCSANNSAGITEKQIYLIVKCEYTHFLQAILKKETKINQKYKFNRIFYDYCSLLTRGLKMN